MKTITISMSVTFFAYFYNKNMTYVCIMGKKYNSSLVGLETLHVDLSFHRCPWLWGQSHLTLWHQLDISIVLNVSCRTENTFFSILFCPLKEGCPSYKMRYKHYEMKWSLIKKGFVFPPSVYSFSLFTIQKEQDSKIS